MVVGAIDSDRIIPLHQQGDGGAAAGLRGIRVAQSAAGHDGFLTEVEWVTELVGETLALARASRVNTAVA